MAPHAPSHGETIAESARAAERFIALATRFAGEVVL